VPRCGKNVAVDGGVRALVVEDDTASRNLYRDVLADAEIACVCVDPDDLPAPDGFTVVLSDLPGSNGHYSSASARDWVKLLRERYHVPIVLITGRSEAARDRELVGDVLSVVEKPLGIDELIAQVQRAHTATI
jgi:DNA-binding response OmpR family regulator